MTAHSQRLEGRNALVTQYAYLCRRGARKFLRPGLDRADLEQVAAIGLIKAGDRYDSGLQTPFEAFAWLFVVGELMHYVRDHERLVRAPRRLRQLDRAYQRVHDDLVVELGYEPSKEQLCRRLQLEPAELDEVRRFREQSIPHSLDVVPASDLASQSYTMDERDSRLMLDSALAGLSAIERTIVLALYANGYTQVELAQRLGYSRRHVSRLHRQALKKMQPIYARASA